MKVTTNITREDYLDFNKFHFVKTRLKQTALIGVVTICIVEFVLNEDHFDLLSTIVSSVVAIALYSFIIYRSISRMKKLPSDNGSILGEKELEFTDEHIAYRTKNAQGTSDWSTITKVAESSRAFYLYMDTNMAIMVPKRAFTNEAELNQFKNIVARNTGK